MISSLSGTVLSVSEEMVTLDIAGIGFDILVPRSLASRHQIGDSVRLNTRMVVREDSITLFGFQESLDRQLFDSLCSISGVGPKLALGLISALGSAGLTRALANQDEGALRSVSGVGQKTARLIIISLADRVPKISVSGRNLVAALQSLGVGELEAQSLASRIDPALEDSEALREALKLRGQRG